MVKFERAKIDKRGKETSSRHSNVNVITSYMTRIFFVDMLTHTEDKYILVSIQFR